MYLSAVPWPTDELDKEITLGIIDTSGLEERRDGG
jgi:hypothetical protein